MIFPKSSKDSGFILLDALVAISIASLYVLIISESTSLSRNIFEFAREKNRLLDTYQSVSEDLVRLEPEQSSELLKDDSLGTISIFSSGRFYGNERVQTDIEVSNLGQSTESKSIISPYLQKVNFSAIGFNSNFGLNRVDSSPLCSVDFVQGRNDKLSKTIIKQIVLPIDPLLPLSDIEVRNGWAYISADSTRSLDADFMVFDIHDSDNPRLVYTIDTGPGISSFTISGRRVFAAAASTASQFQTIYLDDERLLSLENKYRLPLPYATATPPFASSIFSDGQYIYLGTDKWVGEEFVVLDISDSTNPSVMGSLEIDSKVNDIKVYGDRAYIASAGEDQVQVIDIKNLVQPVIIDTFGPSAWNRQAGRTLDYFEGDLDFGRSSGGFDLPDIHELFTFSKASSSLSQVYSLNIIGGVYGLLSDRRKIYLATKEAGSEFVVLDSQATSSQISTYSLPVIPQTLTCDRDILYLLANTAPVLYEIYFK